MTTTTTADSAKLCCEVDRILELSPITDTFPASWVSASAAPTRPVLGGEWLERLLLAPSRSVGIDLHALGVSRPPQPGEQLETVRDAAGTYWTLGTPGLDPTARDGLIPVPAAQVARLRRLSEAEIQFDHLFVAHELPKSWAPGQPLPELVPPAPRIAAAETTVERASRGATRALRATAIGLGVAGAAVAAAPLALGVGALTLDPMIIGGIAVPGHDAVFWAVLAMWKWSD